MGSDDEAEEEEKKVSRPAEESIEVLQQKRDVEFYPQEKVRESSLTGSKSSPTKPKSKGRRDQKSPTLAAADSKHSLKQG